MDISIGQICCIMAPILNFKAQFSVILWVTRSGPVPATPVANEKWGPLSPFSGDKAATNGRGSPWPASFSPARDGRIPTDSSSKEGGEKGYESSTGFRLSNGLLAKGDNHSTVTRMGNTEHLRPREKGHLTDGPFIHSSRGTS